MALDKVTTGVIADNAIDSDQFVDGSVDAVHVASDVATVAGTQTLTNKTLTSPTIGNLSNVTGTLPVGVTGGSGLTALGTVASGAIGSAVTGFTGIKGAQTFRKLSGSTISGSAAIDDWTNSTNGAKGVFGGCVTNSNEEFTFTSTGYYLVLYNVYFYATSGNDVEYAGAYLKDTTNASAGSPTWAETSITYTHMSAGQHSETVYGVSFSPAIIDVTDIAERKVASWVDTGGGGVSVLINGASTNRTTITFIRLGDT